MIADGAGRIINMSSIIATTGHNGLPVCGATKSATTGAREVGKLGITVNAIAPGLVDTELTQSLSEDQRRRIVGRSALRRRRSAMSRGWWNICWVAVAATSAAAC
jgi:3-oxoacyl-[acyl-carrier protein] reductase